MKISKMWAVAVEDKYMAYDDHINSVAGKGTLRVMRGSVLIGEKEVVVNAPGPFGPHHYDNQVWTEAVKSIVTEYEQAAAQRNK